MSTHTPTRLASLLLLLLGALALAPAPRAQEGAPPAIGDDELEFRQERARARLAELEDRMFRLSESIRAAAPDDAARLVLGLSRSREDQLVFEMREVSALIASGELDTVEERQRRLVVRLEELRELLLSVDLDLLLKLQRLRAIDAVLASLEPLRDELASARTGLSAAQELEDQAERRQRMMGLSLLVEELLPALTLLGSETFAAAPDSDAPGHIDAASPLLGTAVETLGEGLGEAASEQLADGARELNRARRALQEAREALCWELQPYVRRAVLDALVEMRDAQGEAVEAMRAAREGMSSQQSALLPEGLTRPLLDRQRTVDDQTKGKRELVIETEFSVPLPYVFDYVRLHEERALGAIAAGAVEAADLRSAERALAAIEESLQVLLEEERRWRSNPRAEVRRLVKLIGELKEARSLQQLVRADTAYLDVGGDAEAGAPSERDAATLATLHALEDSLVEVLDELDERYYAELVDQEL